MDSRDMVRAQGKWYKEFDKDRMIVFVELYMNESELDEANLMRPDEKNFDNEEIFQLHLKAWDFECIIRELPVKMTVCGTCKGKGKHVNPSIDAHGITREEFDADPDFERAYFSGQYDVACYECGGDNVVPEIDENLVNTDKYKDTYARFQKDEENRRQCAAEDAAEARYFGYY